tara:strand:- start:220 stop:744 length:525 start_codon:yes stop_codon:yes gene_type:complete
VVNFNRAIFLDRDGVIIKAPTLKNKPKSIKRLKELEFIKGIISFCKYYKKKKFILIMITNQPEVSRKKNSKKNVLQINNFIQNKLKLDDIFVCYSDNDKCFDRKPNPGMVLKSKSKYNLNLKKSYIIGDRWRDVGVGQKTQCNSILIDRNYDEKMIFKPNHIVKKIGEIYKIIK